MFGDAGETPYDLRFRLFGVNVRVHPMFWLISVLFNLDSVQNGRFAELGVWIVCLFVSILVHEMGHVLTGRLFGSYGDIVLYGMGGLAMGSTQGLTKRWQRILVLLMGPGAGFILFAAVLLGVLLADFRQLPRLAQVAVFDLIGINLFWGVVNLLPVWPLDGGQISGLLFSAVRPRDGMRMSLQLSVVVGVAIALISLAQHFDRPMLPFYVPALGIWTAILFGMLAFSSYQMLQQIPRDPWHEERYERTSWERDSDEWRR